MDTEDKKFIVIISLMITILILFIIIIIRQNAIDNYQNDYTTELYNKIISLQKQLDDENRIIESQNKDIDSIIDTMYLIVNNSNYNNERIDKLYNGSFY